MSVNVVFVGLDPDRPDRTERLAMLLPLPKPVKKDELIARSPEEGDGAVSTLVVEQLDTLVGEGVTLRKEKENPDIFSLVAGREGYLCDRDGVLVVTKVCELYRDIDTVSGDFTGDGPVRIHGGVLAGRTVTVNGDIEILGLVEGARIKATGNVLLRGGIAGGEEGFVSAGRDLLASYAQQATLEAAGSIVLEGPAMNAHLTAGKKIVLKGRASVVGGSVRAREEIEAPVIGSESAVPTDVALGYDPFHSRMVRELTSEREAFDEEERMAMKGVAFAAERLDNPPSLVRDDLLSNVFAMSDLLRAGGEEELSESEAKYRKELGNALMGAMEVERKRESLEESVGEQAAPYPAASLKVERVAHPGVTVSILAHTILLDREYERVKFIIKGDGIEPIYL